MAISQMQKISIILPKAQLDQALTLLQAQAHMEVRTLTDREEWQAAFESALVSQPELVHLDAASQQALTGDEVLQGLAKRQQQLEHTIAELRTYLPKLGMVASLKQAKPTATFEALEASGQSQVQAQVLEEVQAKFEQLKHIDSVLSETEEEIARLRAWGPLEVTPTDLAAFTEVKAVVGTLPASTEDAQLKALQANEQLTYQQVFASETAYGLLIFYAAQDGPEVQAALDSYEFKPLDYPYEMVPAERLVALETLVQEKREEKQAIEQTLSTAQEQLLALESQLDYTLNAQARQQAKQATATTTHLVALEGWVESLKVAELKTSLYQELGDGILIQEADVEAEDWEEVPVKLVNNGFVEPFEGITEMYALPKYYEKDPTPVVAPFYFVFFGMMVADLGYGVILYLVTLWALKSFHLDKGQARFLKFFNYLGISTAIWGLVYGSAFGFELPFKLISTTADVMTILGISVVFGFITLLTGLVMGGMQQARMKDYAEAYNSGFAWVMILSGIALLAVGKLLPQFSFLGTIGSLLAIANAIGILVVSVKQAKGLGGLGSGLFNLYNISSYVGDLVSFTRLMALGLSGASIGSAFNLIVGILPPAARFTVGILLFVLLHAVNMFLSLLSGYVHGARLMFVELFGKFYQGGGKAFQPLKPAEKYVNIIKETQMEDK